MSLYSDSNLFFHCVSEHSGKKEKKKKKLWVFFKIIVPHLGSSVPPFLDNSEWGLQ